MRRQECNSESVERRQVKRAPSGKYGENHGDPMHFSCHRYSEMYIRCSHVIPGPRYSVLLNSPMKSRSGETNLSVNSQETILIRSFRRWREPLEISKLR
jgi:hypothetical protein